MTKKTLLKGYTCACGRQNTILDTHIVKTEYPVTRPYVKGTVG